MDITTPDKEHTTTTNQKIPTLINNNQPDLADNQPVAPTDTIATRSGTQNPYPSAQNSQAPAHPIMPMDTEMTKPLADLADPPTSSENDGEVTPTPQSIPNTMLPRTDETDSQDGSIMDTDSNHTIQDKDVLDKGKQPSYSQVVSGTKMTRATRIPNLFKLERETKWTKQFNSALAKL